MDRPANLRAQLALAHLRGRKPCLVVCRDDPSPVETAGDALAALGAELVIERRPGPLSAVLGRPSVTVCDRYLDVELHEPDPEVDEVLSVLAWLEMRCEECPQSAEEHAP